MNKVSFKVLLLIFFIAGVGSVQAQWKVKIKMPNDRNAPGKVVDVPKIIDATYLSATKQVFVRLGGGGGTLYKFNASTGRFTQSPVFNNALYTSMHTDNIGRSGVYVFKKGNNTYCHFPLKGRTFLLPEIKTFYNSATSTYKASMCFDGIYLMSPAYTKNGSKPNFKNGVLLYMDVHKDTQWKTLLLHSALNKAVKGTKYYKGHLKAENIWHIRKAGNGYMVAFKYGNNNLLAWMKLSITSASIKIASIKIVDDRIPPMVDKKVFSYRAKTYIEDGKGVKVYDYNGNRVEYYRGKRFLDLMRENKVPVSGKYCIIQGGKIIYDKSKNAPAYNHMVFANNKAIQFKVKERSYPQGQQSKLQPFWYLMAEQQ